jgi:hypothetical protein
MPAPLNNNQTKGETKMNIRVDFEVPPDREEAYKSAMERLTKKDGYEYIHAAPKHYCEAYLLAVEDSTDWANIEKAMAQAVACFEEMTMHNPMVQARICGPTTIGNTLAELRSALKRLTSANQRRHEDVEIEEAKTPTAPAATEARHD